MAKNLVIVESPAKAKTIQGYLGKDFKVIATVGHMIDLPKSKLGVDISSGYEMEYTPISGKNKVITEIKKAIKATDGTVYLAPDPDREGESIAWQVANLAKMEKEDGKKLQRAVFHEITKSAVNDAIKNTRKIDTDLVEAQRSRRVLDRLVGYPLSQLLWKKIQYGLSAGRVQSVALRLIVEREDEIRAFVPSPYWLLSVRYENIAIPFTLVDKKGVIAKLEPAKGEEIKNLLEQNNQHEVVEHSVKPQATSPAPPLTTSTMQQAANRLFGFSAKMTMKAAQELYQGINLKEKGGLTGLITYMRTDSVALSSQFISAAREFIQKKYGKSFLNETERRYKTKSRVAQEAHEAIRPTKVDITPEEVKPYLTAQQYKLYSLIWRKAVATQMSQRVVDKESIKVLPVDKDARNRMEKEKLILTVTAEKEVFAGFSILAPIAKKETETLPQLKKGDVLHVQSVVSEELFTVPKSRFNDASLVKEMERLGIGRPSTYAAIISTLMTRNYIERKEKLLYPTAVGEVVCNFLKKNFIKIVDYAFTAEMEEQLDDIANAKKTKKEMLDAFYPSFQTEIDEKSKTIKKEELIILEHSEKPCRKCGKNMVLKLGPYGKYYQCPDETCKTTEPYFDEEKYFVPDEVKKEGYILKKSRFGMFWAHPDYPNVKKILPLLLKDLCPECGSHLVERKGKTGRPFIGCSGYPKCKYIKSKFVRKAGKKKKDEQEEASGAT